jgi:hypothetical protein
MPYKVKIAPGHHRETRWSGGRATKLCQQRHRLAREPVHPVGNHRGDRWLVSGMDTTTQGYLGLRQKICKVTYYVVTSNMVG